MKTFYEFEYSNAKWEFCTVCCDVVGLNFFSFNGGVWNLNDCWMDEIIEYLNAVEFPNLVLMSVALGFWYKECFGEPSGVLSYNYIWQFISNV